IHSQLHAGQAMALSQPQAISGLGGVGKTQIAVEYAYRYSQAYQIVLWVQAENIDTLNASYSQLAAKLNLPEKEEGKQEIIVRAVKTWLQDHRYWLLVLDNADELTLLNDFLPPVVGGHLLIYYYQQDKHTEAEALFQRALRIREKQLESEHSLMVDPLSGPTN